MGRPAKRPAMTPSPERKSGLPMALAAYTIWGFLPLYIALPWKETAQHDELLEIVLRQRPEFGRAHYPAKVRAMERSITEH